MIRIEYNALFQVNLCFLNFIFLKAEPSNLVVRIEMVGMTLQHHPKRLHRLFRVPEIMKIDLPHQIRSIRIFRVFSQGALQESESRLDLARIQCPNSLVSDFDRFLLIQVTPSPHQNGENKCAFGQPSLRSTHCFALNKNG